MATVEEHARAASGALSNERLRKLENVLHVLFAVGAIIVVIGTIAGLVIALHSRVAPCEDGHYFPAGTTDLRCYAHPHAIAGGLTIGASVMAGVVLAILAIMAQMIIASSARDDAPH